MTGARAKWPEWWGSSRRYKYLGGVRSRDIWGLNDAVYRTHGEWDIYMFNVDYSNQHNNVDYYDMHTAAAFDIYLSRNPQIRSNQTWKFEQAKAAITTDDFESVSGLVLCFAPYLLRGETSSFFRPIKALLGKALTDA